MIKRAFRHCAKSIRSFYPVAGIYFWSKLPGFFSRQRIHVHSPFQEVTGSFRKLGQRVLKTVINLSQKTGSYFDRQHISGKFNFIANGNTAGNFEYLKLANIAANSNNFAF
jgi:hypothetical protein